jgi:hypothetical protein
MLIIFKAMKTTLLLIVLAIVGCGGSLSDEQRKEMREKMELNRIVHITEIEITEAAFSKGREIAMRLEELKNDSARLNSYLRRNAARIHYIKPGVSTLHALEQQLLEAYLADHSDSLQDNVQKVRNGQGDFDSVLYTRPVITKSKDGSRKLDGVWNIWLAKKELVLDIGKSR